MNRTEYSEYGDRTTVRVKKSRKAERRFEQSRAINFSLLYSISTEINVNKVDCKIIINWPKIFVKNLALKICVVKIENFRTEKTVGTNEGGVYNARYKVPKDFI